MLLAPAEPGQPPPPLQSGGRARSRSRPLACPTFSRAKPLVARRRAAPAGLSLRTQELTAAFLTVRLFCSFMMEYDIHTLLDFLTLVATGARAPRVRHAAGKASAAGGSGALLGGGRCSQWPKRLAARAAV